LKPSGVLRIIVPDAGRYLEAYNGQGWSALKELRGIHDGFHDSYYTVRFTSKIELVNLIFRQFSEHKFGYDYDCLKSILLAAGYVKVAKVGFGISCDPTVAIDQLSRQHESLYVEAIKP
jgi:predicted SAM-dependent methyltransferase